MGFSTGGKFNPFQKFNDIPWVGVVSESFFLRMLHMNLVEVGCGGRRLREGKSGGPGRA